MKGPSDYMLTCIGEEAGEVSQVIGKIDRFGCNDVKPGTSESNAERLRAEFHDILATYMEYCDIEHIPFDIDDVLIKEKLRRVYTYKLLSYLNDRYTIHTDLHRIIECIFADHPHQQDYMDIVCGELTLYKLEQLHELVSALPSPPKYLLPALEKLMLCMN